MAEFWKSTPSYWCKLCETFVRDTKFERRRHESTARHQGGIQRQLRDAHRQKGIEERDKRKVQAEIARLNKLVPGAVSAEPEAEPKPAIDSERVSWKRKALTFADTRHKRATAEDLKKQAEQLAGLGVDVPDAYRGTGSGPSGWEVVSVTPVEDVKKEEHVKEEEEEDENGEWHDHEADVHSVRKVKKEESDQEGLLNIPERLMTTRNKTQLTEPVERRKRVKQLEDDDLEDLFGSVAKKTQDEPTRGSSSPVSWRGGRACRR